MKKYISILLLALLACLPTMAQPQPQRNNGGRPPFSPEEFKAKMDSYIRDKADLTQDEADKVFPIYHEMKQKQMELNDQIRKLKQPGKGKEAADCTKAITQITQLNVKLAKLEQTYYAKMCKAIDSRKVFGIMRAEDAFHREMLRKVGGQRPGMKPGQGGRKAPAPRRD